MDPDAETPLNSVEVRHLGGALARPVPGGGAQPSIDAGYLLYAVGVTPTPDLAAAVRTHLQTVKNALAPWHAGYDYYDLKETPAAASAVFPPASYRRLQEIRATYDPDQVIISTHPVWPKRLGRGAEMKPRTARETTIICAGPRCSAISTGPAPPFRLPPAW